MNIELSFTPQTIEMIRNIFREELENNAEKIRKKPKNYPRKEAFKIIGCSHPTGDKYIREGRLKSNKIGGRVYISEQALNEFINGSHPA